jgi:DNA-binding CsgD family transcriptional regulator
MSPASLSGQYFFELPLFQSTAVIILNELGRVVSMNNYAQLLLDRDDGISIKRGELKIRPTEGSELFKKYINNIIKQLGENANLPVFSRKISINHKAEDYHIVVKPVSVGNEHTPHITPFIQICIREACKPPDISDDILMELYGFTLCEVNVAVLLAKGFSGAQICQQLNIKKSTVRSHLRSLFSKTGVSQQSMLVSVVLSSLANRW